MAYGAYSFETDSHLIYRTNFQFATRLLPRLEDRSIACYVHAGSSSEYGDMAAGPGEMDPTAPNSDYAVSKVATASLIYFHGKRKRLPCANLRLYSVYGPLEDSSRLIPNLIRARLAGRIPRVRQSRGVEGLRLHRRCGRGVRRHDARICSRPTMASRSTSARAARPRSAKWPRRPASCFGIDAEPAFTMPDRSWDVPDWYANIDKARDRARSGSREPASRKASREPLDGTSPCRTSVATSDHPRSSASTPFTASARSSPATRTTRRFPIMYERLRRDVLQAEHRFRDHLRQ